MGRKLNRREFSEDVVTVSALGVLGEDRRRLVLRAARALLLRALAPDRELRAFAKLCERPPSKSFARIKVSLIVRQTMRALNWREPQGGDGALAWFARTAFASAFLYPPHPYSSPEFDALAASQRMMLPQVIEDLERADLYVIFELARVLALHPPTEATFEQARQVL